MKNYIIILLTLFTIQIGYGQCPISNISLSSQEDVNNFVANYPNCTSINYSLSISGTVNDLTSLNMITSIGGSLNILNTNLMDLNGLNNITDIGGNLIIKGNDSLLNLNVSSSIQQINGELIVRNNDTLTDLGFMSNLQSVDLDITIDNNDALLNIDGLNALTDVGGELKIIFNDNLQNLNGFTNLNNTIDKIYIAYNSSLSDISGFNNLGQINTDLIIFDNNSLTSIAGFSNLLQISGDLEIIENSSLNLIGGFNNLQLIENDIFIHDNMSLSAINSFQNLTNINGSFELSENETLNNLNGFNILNQIDENLIIKDNDQITNFSNFSSLNAIQGNFEIVSNSSLVNFNGLQNLQNIGTDFICNDNNSLLNFIGLNNLASISGDFSIVNNESLVNFQGLENLVNINNNMVVMENNVLTELNALNNLENVGGDLQLGSNLSSFSSPSLTQIPFNSLSQVGGDLIIVSLQSITNISGFNALTTVGGKINIAVNHNLIDITGFQNLNTAGNVANTEGVEIRFNEGLQQIPGFNALTQINGDLTILFNRDLVTIQGFQNLETIMNNLYINQSDSLTDISGFNALNTINNHLIIGEFDDTESGASTGNLVLSSLNGLNNVTTVGGDLRITTNPALTDIDPLANLVSIGGILHVDGSGNNLGNGSLQNLQLPSLTSISGIDIKDNLALTAFNFPNLNQVDGYVKFTRNHALSNFIGFENTSIIQGSLIIDWNDALDNFEGFNNLNTVGALIIRNVQDLIDFSGLEALTTIFTNFPNELGDGYIRGDLRIQTYSSSLTSLLGLSSLVNVKYVRIANNPSLSDISDLNNVAYQNIEDFDILNNPNLSVCDVNFICNYLSLGSNPIHFSNNANGCNGYNEVLSTCTSALNMISGNLLLNINQAGCSVNSDVLSNQMVIADNGNTTFSTFSDADGAFLIYTSDGNYSVTSSSELPAFYTSNPTSFNVIFTNFGNSEVGDFCFESTNVASDLNITIIPPIDEPRPGFDTSYQIIYSNIGTTQLSGDITFNFDDSKIQFLSASETLTSQTANILTFNYSNLNPFETRTIDLNFNVFPPPITNIDDELISTVSINPTSGDVTQQDNTFTLNQTVIGSYDPNDIQILEGDQVHIDDADEYLHFLIRFQNTGTASAINVRVEHILDNKLDWTTMHLQSLSHDGRVEITDGSDVQFIFNNINLPDQTSDEEGSIGYIAFKIKPLDNIIVGDIISGVADIYFDFNPPIITNTAMTEFVDNLGNDSFSLNKISIYPNPTDGLLNIKSTSDIEQIEVFDMLGRQLLSGKYRQTDAEVDLSTLENGIYFVRIETNGKTEIRKIIKK